MFGEDEREIEKKEMRVRESKWDMNNNICLSNFVGNVGVENVISSSTIVSQPIDNYLNPIKPKFILNLGTPFKSRDKLLKDLFCTTSKVEINC